MVSQSPLPFIDSLKHHLFVSILGRYMGYPQSLSLEKSTLANSSSVVTLLPVSTHLVVNPSTYIVLVTLVHFERDPRNTTVEPVTIGYINLDQTFSENEYHLSGTQ